jgi:hypothetical protein
MTYYKLRLNLFGRLDCIATLKDHDEQFKEKHSNPGIKHIGIDVLNAA